MKNNKFKIGDIFMFDPDDWPEGSAYDVGVTIGIIIGFSMQKEFEQVPGSERMVVRFEKLHSPEHLANSYFTLDSAMQTYSTILG